MLGSCFETVVAIILNSSLNHIDLKEISHFLSKKYFFLNLDWVSKLWALFYFFTGLDPALMEHVIVSDESFHHRLE